MSSESEISVAVARQDKISGVSIRNSESFFLPSAELKEYESTCPGLGKRLTKTLERQVYHRMEMEKMELEKKYALIEKNSNVNIAIGFLVLVLSAVLAIFFAFWGMEKAAIAAVCCPALEGLAYLIHARKNTTKKKS
ncbi:MAG: DUF2335 domain-containing protein [Planctomycetaceae bacterium]|jgi:uncharacterized membrane protein|nr:DUF2335 domain-containing protein [Planctomycetaceae bacterium]